MRRSIRKRLRTSEPTTALCGFAKNPLPPATYSLLLGGFFRIHAGTAIAASPPPPAPTDHAAARTRPRRWAVAADRDRSRGQGVPGRAQEPRAQRLRPQRDPNRRRDRPDQQELLRKARRPRRPL